MSEPTKPPAMSALRSSRKVMLVWIACAPIALAILLAEVLIFVEVIRGKLGVEAGIGLMFGGVLAGAAGVVPLVISAINGFTKEDVARTIASRKGES
jgi:hypothetical protein